MDAHVGKGSHLDLVVEVKQNASLSELLMSRIPNEHLHVNDGKIHTSQTVHEPTRSRKTNNNINVFNGYSCPTLEFYFKQTKQEICRDKCNSCLAICSIFIVVLISALCYTVVQVT